jgi:hypothetical protein
MMRNRSIWLTLGLVMLIAGYAGNAGAWQASPGEQYVGMWAGSYDGAATGTMEMILDKGKDGGVTGKVNVVSDGGNYSADFKSIVFDGSKATAKYDFPLDPSAEVIMTATFEGAAAKGTWSLRPKGQTDEIAGGGIAISKR